MVSHLAISTDGFWSEDGGGDTYIYNLPINLEVCSSDINYNLNENEINIDCDSGSLNIEVGIDDE